MIAIYATLISKGKLTIDNVRDEFKNDVLDYLQKLGYDGYGQKL